MGMPIDSGLYGIRPGQERQPRCGAGDRAGRAGRSYASGEARKARKKLIEAVVAVVEKGAPPPPVLVLEWDAQRYHTLPETGGLFAQDYGLLKKMKAAGNVHETLSRFRGMIGKEIHRLSDSERRLIRALRQ